MVSGVEKTTGINYFVLKRRVYDRISMPEQGPTTARKVSEACTALKRLDSWKLNIQSERTWLRQGAEHLTERKKSVAPASCTAPGRTVDAGGLLYFGFGRHAQYYWCPPTACFGRRATDIGNPVASTMKIETLGTLTVVSFKWISLHG
jgi:hypothetical protein